MLGRTQLRIGRVYSRSLADSNIFHSHSGNCEDVEEFQGAFKRRDLGPRLKDQVEWGLRGAPEMRKAPRGYHLAQPFFTGLGPEREAHLL
jgi:hypothetical protein